MTRSNRPRWTVTSLGVMALLMSGLTPALADVKLPALFADHAVLQRDRPLPIWGWASPGEKVSVALGTQTGEATTEADGRWRITLPAQPVSKQPLTLTVSSRNTIVLRDILLGDVWLCSGQSNMSISVGHYGSLPNVKADMAAADAPQIRQFGVLGHFADEPQTDVTGEWLVCSPRTVSRFSAVAFYFARKVHAETGVPIGIVRSAKGSTTIECWLSQSSLLAARGLEPFAAKMKASLVQWERDKALARQNGLMPGSPGYPPYPFGEKVRRPRCVTLHNGMIAPLAPLAIRGVVWYQGEGNAGDVTSAKQYRFALETLIRDWRGLFHDAELPFYVVQLPAYREEKSDPGVEEAWAYLREAQRACLAMPRTGLAVTIDIGEAEDIHPKNKADVGNRLARLALAEVYAKTIEPCGPLLRKLRIEGNTAVIEFDHAGAGLMTGTKVGLEPVKEQIEVALKRFAIAGADRKWVWANARIEGHRVVCSHPSVTQPVAVRYGFTANPAAANLYNRDGLPAAPFRTDDW